jgi:CO dehydrogenase/acetyl-CoA synthase delta subunit
MPITAGKPENNMQFELAPKGTHIARVYKLINLGTLKTEWQGKEKDTKKIRLYFELPTEEKVYTNKEGIEIKDVHTISAEYTLSMGDRAKLKPIVEGIIGTSLQEDEAYNFDVESLVGMTCLITIKHEKTKDGSREYSVIASTASLMKGMTAPEPVKKAEIIDVNTITDEQLAELHEKIQEKITSSKEWKLKAQAVKNGFDGFDEINPEDIPF